MAGRTLWMNRHSVFKKSRRFYSRRTQGPTCLTIWGQGKLVLYIGSGITLIRTRSQVDSSWSVSCQISETLGQMKRSK